MIYIQPQTVDMKNLSENKTPQATCSGDAKGRFYGLGTAWTSLFLFFGGSGQKGSGRPK